MIIIFVIVFQVLIFAGLIFILKRTLTSNIASATNHLDTLNQEYTKKEDDLNRRIEETKNRSQELIDASREEAEKLKGVYFVGRLAEYKYYNMDQAIKRALDVFEQIKNGE